MEHILTPIAMILALALPLSDSKYTFSFPLLVKAVCPGLFNIEAGFISDVQVIKGGENQDITFQQQPGSVDVRFTLSSLYETMTATTQQGHEDDTNIERPTLKRYIDNLKDSMSYDYPFGEGPSGGGGGEGDSSFSNIAGMMSSGTDFSNPLGRVSGDIGSLFDSLTGGLGELSNFLGDSLSGISDFTNDTTDIFDSLSRGSQEVTNSIDNLTNGVSDIVNSIGDIGNILNGFSNLLSNIPEQPSASTDLMRSNYSTLLDNYVTRPSVRNQQTESNIASRARDIDTQLTRDVSRTEGQMRSTIQRRIR
jgi:archaellum component FlaC